MEPCPTLEMKVKAPEIAVDGSDHAKSVVRQKYFAVNKTRGIFKDSDPSLQ